MHMFHWFLFRQQGGFSREGGIFVDGIYRCYLATASVTPSTNATAASTISTMTSSTLKQTKYAGVSHGKIEPNKMPTGNEGRDIFENETTEGNGPGKWLLNWILRRCQE